MEGTVLKCHSLGKVENYGIQYVLTTSRSLTSISPGPLTTHYTLTFISYFIHTYIHIWTLGIKSSFFFCLKKVLFWKWLLWSSQLTGNKTFSTLFYGCTVLIFALWFSWNKAVLWTNLHYTDWILLLFGQSLSAFSGISTNPKVKKQISSVTSYHAGVESHSGKENFLGL